MKKVNVAEGKHVLLDACPRHDGIWFDGGEVDHLIEYLEQWTSGQKGHGEVFNFIKEVFGANTK
jgi:Zn-finger nucleic acid-binding protein